MIRLLPSRSVPTTSPYTWRRWLRDHLTDLAYRTLNRLGVPGAVAPMSFRDEATGCTLTVANGHRFTIVTVDGRDFYFDRITGKFDGTGAPVG